MGETTVWKSCQEQRIWRRKEYEITREKGDATIRV